MTGKSIKLQRMLSMVLALVLILSCLPAGILTVQAEEESSLAGETISILGDSISTYKGYIPTADGVNLAHATFYPNGAISAVEQTWWHQVITGLDARLGINESWSGSRVLNTQDTNSGNLGPDAAMASMTRIRNLGSNGTPDVILFFGGTNDIAFNSPLGSFDPASAPVEADLTATKWTTYADAYVAAIMRMQHLYPAAQIVAIQPGPNKHYYTNETLAEYSEVAEAICTHYGVVYCDLVDGGLTTDMLADVTHPNAEGMTKIAQIVMDTLSAHSLTLQYDDHYDVTGKTVEILDAGENTVVTLAENTLIAAGIGTAKVRMDGEVYHVTVEKAKINLVVIMGQSNAGNHFANATSDVTCPPGTAYWWGNGQGTAATEPVPYTQPSMGFHTPLLAELYAQSVAAGSPEKNVMIWHEGITSKNGKSITAWASSAENTSGTDATVTMIQNCVDYYTRNSDKYEIVGKGVYWLQGESDLEMDPVLYTQRFMAMWDRLKAAGMEYMAFFRVRRSVYQTNATRDDLYYSASLSAQLKMVAENPDMFLATTVTENWIGEATAQHTVDIRNYITLMDAYGRQATHTDSYGNDATFADGMLTTPMKTLYGSNNACHYGKFGYGIIGADAAYNMYRALHTEVFSIAQTDISGYADRKTVSEPGTVQTIDITHMTDDLVFRPGCGSAAGTMAVQILSGETDITDADGLIHTTGQHYGAVSVEKLKEYNDVKILITYTTEAGNSGVVTYNIHCNKLNLRYDDRCDVTGKTVEIIDAGTPVSSDTAVVALEGDVLRAVGVGTAEVKIDGVYYRVTVEKAKISLIMIMGMSNSGNHFPNATSQVVCPPGTAYWWQYGASAPVDYSEPSMGFHAPLLAELYAQSVAAGDPVKNVMLWQEGFTSKNGGSIKDWVVEEGDTLNTDGNVGAVSMVKDCLAYYAQHSDQYEIVDKCVYWILSGTDHAMDAERFIRLFTTMWEQLKDAGMEYLAFFRVRGAHSLATPENVDVLYNGPAAAQFEMVRTREDMFMASTITEAWTGPVGTSHSVDIRKYITVMEAYGQNATYSDQYGNKATYADGVLTTTMKELYGSNNKVHYGIFGYGLIGADAAINMYAALHGNGVPSITQTDSSGFKSAETICAMGSTHTLNIDEIDYPLSFYPSCGSPAGTMQIQVTSEGRDITRKVVSKTYNSYGCIDTQALRGYAQCVIVVSYTYAGVTEQVEYIIESDHPCSNGHTYENGVCTICGFHLPGDINGDGEVNNKDATRLFQYLSGWEVEVVEAALDVNGDGKVNNKDATRLFQHLSGWDVEIH